MSDDFEELRKRVEQDRKDRINAILKLAEKHCPMSYAKFVHLVFLELGLPYRENQKRGVYNKEVDSLIVVGKLKLKRKKIHYG
jgi:hypothetical protein